MAYEREMSRLKATEQLEAITAVAIGFGSLPSETIRSIMEQLHDEAEIERSTPVGRDLGAMTREEKASVFAQFGIPVSSE